MRGARIAVYLRPYSYPDRYLEDLAWAHTAVAASFLRQQERAHTSLRVRIPGVCLRDRVVASACALMLRCLARRSCMRTKALKAQDIASLKRGAVAHASAKALRRDRQLRACTCIGDALYGGKQGKRKSYALAATRSRELSQVRSL